MEKISMPTDIFLRMLDWDLDADEQLLFLALILNRLVNMTGVYSITHREMRHQIPPRDNDGGWLQRALERLQAKRLVYYDEGILFIPLIPETSSYARHVFRHRMQQQVDRLGKKHPSNVALRAFADWCATNVSPENRSTSSEMHASPEREQNLQTSDKNQNHAPRQTLAEKYANMSQNERFAASFDHENISLLTDKNKERLGRGSRESQQSLTKDPSSSSSSSSSLSSSYYSRRSTGIDVKGGAGKIWPAAQATSVGSTAANRNSVMVTWVTLTTRRLHDQERLLHLADRTPSHSETGADPRLDRKHHLRAALLRADRDLRRQVRLPLVPVHHAGSKPVAKASRRGKRKAHLRDVRR